MKNASPDGPMSQPAPTGGRSRALCSQRWYDSQDMRGFAHRQRTQQMGLRREEFLGRPVIGIINTWSDMSPCHTHLRQRAEAVKRGVLMAGGYPAIKSRQPEAASGGGAAAGPRGASGASPSPAY